MSPANPGRTLPLWARTAVPAFDDVLPASLTTDVCVVGAGIAGISTAYVLQRAGKQVIVLDDGPVGGGETVRTTAHLSSALDDRYFHLETVHGGQGARLAADSHSAAIDWIEQIVADEHIDCDFRRLDGYLLLAPEQDAALLDRELAAAHRAGLVEVERLEDSPLASWSPGACLRFPRQAQFHPIAYLAGLTNAFVRAGGRLFTGAHVESVDGGQPARVHVRGGPTVTADVVVVATYTPIHPRVAIHTKQAAYRSYVIGVEVPRGSVPTGLYWDTLHPYHYVRLANGASASDAATEILIVGGEDHTTGQTEDADADERWARLERWTREHFAMAGEVTFRWSGQIMEPADSLAFIGRLQHDDPSVYVATGDSGHGMTHATIAALLIADLVDGRENPWARLYDPARVSLRAAGEYARENLNTMAQYADWLHGSNVERVEDIPLGQGAVLRRGMKGIAVYRDFAGECHAVSAACPHLGGMVRWNSGEQTWDCPCHGSRFDAYGKVLNGPAVDDLPDADDVLGDENETLPVVEAANEPGVPA